MYTLIARDGTVMNFKIMLFQKDRGKPSNITWAEIKYDSEYFISNILEQLSKDSIFEQVLKEKKYGFIMHMERLHDVQAAPSLIPLYFLINASILECFFSIVTTF